MVTVSCKYSRSRLAASLLLLLLSSNLSVVARDTIEVEEEARRLEELLVAPCCFNQTLRQHQSAVAETMKEDIRRRLVDGEPPEAIIESYVEEHGPQVLSRPPPSGFQRLLYLAPPLFFALTAIGLFAYMRRLAGPREEAKEAPGASVERARSKELRDRLRRELDELD